jgi:hypothetical protein
MLARTTSFRDALLSRQPVLLDAFLERVLVAGEIEVGERHTPISTTGCLDLLTEQIHSITQHALLCSLHLSLRTLCPLLVSPDLSQS